MPGETILIVDDDTALRELLCVFLREHGFQVHEAADVPSMRSAMARNRPDLILLDLMMPGEDGLAGLRTMNPHDRPAVIVLSTLGSETDRIVGLEMGADDYIAKPCNPRELLARIRAVLRRAGVAGMPDTPIHFAGWRLEPRRWRVFDPDGEPLDLTNGEFRLLHCLAGARGEVLSRDRLAVHLGGEDVDYNDRAIDIAISRLRRKLAERNGQNLIRTVRGEGYALATGTSRGE